MNGLQDRAALPQENILRTNRMGRWVAPSRSGGLAEEYLCREPNPVLPNLYPSHHTGCTIPALKT